MSAPPSISVGTASASNWRHVEVATTVLIRYQLPTPVEAFLDEVIADGAKHDRRRNEAGRTGKERPLLLREWQEVQTMPRCRIRERSEAEVVRGLGGCACTTRLPVPWPFVEARAAIEATEPQRHDESAVQGQLYRR